MFSKLAVPDKVAAEILHWFPKQAFSRSMGWASRVSLPRPLRDPIYRSFAKRFGVDLTELDRPLSEFDRFDDFFCRPLPGGARTIVPGEEVIASPCDGVLSTQGLTHGGLCLQAKGHDYTIASLLQDDEAARQFLGGMWMTIYLAPHNYHRVHAPMDSLVAGFRHVPGARYPVNELSVRSVPGLFARNERLITFLQTPHGPLALVMVAATGVGNITVSYEPGLSTCAGGPDRGACQYDEPRPLAKGAELGMFHLGSTVILLFPPGFAVSEMVEGSQVRVGQRIARTKTLRGGA